eukprot:g4691.t1
MHRQPGSPACRARVMHYCQAGGGFKTDPSCFRINRGPARLFAKTCPFKTTTTSSPCTSHSCRLGSGGTSECRAAIIEYCKSSDGKGDPACWSFLPRNCPFQANNPAPPVSPCQVPACAAGHIGTTMCRSAVTTYCNKYAQDPACASLLPGGAAGKKGASCKFLTTPEAKAAGSPCFAAGGACMGFVSGGGRLSSATTFTRSVQSNYVQYPSPTKVVDITGISRATEAVITARNSFRPGDRIIVSNVKGMTQINGKECVIKGGYDTKQLATSFVCTGLDTSDAAKFFAYTSGGLATLAARAAVPTGTSLTSRCRAVVSIYCASSFAKANDPTCYRLVSPHGGNTPKGKCPFSTTAAGSPCDSKVCNPAFGSSPMCRAFVTDYCHGSGGKTDPACYSLVQRGKTKAVAATAGTTVVTVTPAANSAVRVSSGSTFSHCPFKADLPTSPCKVAACTGPSGPRAVGCRASVAAYCSSRCGGSGAPCTDAACLSVLVQPSKKPQCPFNGNAARNPCGSPDCGFGLKDTTLCRAAVRRYCHSTAGKVDAACHGVFSRSSTYGAPEFHEATPTVSYFKHKIPKKTATISGHVAGAWESDKYSHNGFHIHVKTKGKVTGGSWAVYENDLRPTTVARHPASTVVGSSTSPCCGLDAAMAQKLTDNGFKTVRDLESVAPEVLAQRLTVGKNEAVAVLQDLGLLAPFDAPSEYKDISGSGKWASGSYLTGALSSFSDETTRRLSGAHDGRGHTHTHASKTTIEDCKMMPTKTYWLYVEIHYKEASGATHARTSRALRLRSPHDLETLPPIFVTDTIKNRPLPVPTSYNTLSTANGDCSGGTGICPRETLRTVGPRFDFTYVLREDAQAGSVKLTVKREAPTGAAEAGKLAEKFWAPFATRRRQLRLAGGHLVLRDTTRGRLLHTNPPGAPANTVPAPPNNQGGDAGMPKLVGGELPIGGPLDGKNRGDAQWDTTLRQRAARHPYFTCTNTASAHFTDSMSVASGAQNSVWKPTAKATAKQDTARTKKATGEADFKDSKCGECGVHIYRQPKEMACAGGTCQLASGQYTITVAYSDWHGHTPSQVTSYNFFVDSNPPSITVQGPGTVTAGNQVPTAVLTSDYFLTAVPVDAVGNIGARVDVKMASSFACPNTFKPKDNGGAIPCSDSGGVCNTNRCCDKVPEPSKNVILAIKLKERGATKTGGVFTLQTKDPVTKVYWLAREGNVATRLANPDAGTGARPYRLCNPAAAVRTECWQEEIVSPRAKVFNVEVTRLQSGKAYRVWFALDDPSVPRAPAALVYGEAGGQQGEGKALNTLAADAIVYTAYVSKKILGVEDTKQGVNYGSSIIGLKMAVALGLQTDTEFRYVLVKDPRGVAPQEEPDKFNGNQGKCTEQKSQNGQPFQYKDNKCKEAPINFPETDFAKLEGAIAAGTCPPEMVANYASSNCGTVTVTANGATSKGLYEFIKIDNSAGKAAAAVRDFKFAWLPGSDGTVKQNDRWAFLFRPPNARISVFEITPQNEKQELSFSPALIVNGYTPSSFGDKEKKAMCTALTKMIDTDPDTCQVETVTKVEGAKKSVEVKYKITLKKPEDVANSKVKFDALEELYLQTDPKCSESKTADQCKPPYPKSTVKVPVTLKGVALADLTPQEQTNLKSAQKAAFAKIFKVLPGEVEVTLKEGTAQASSGSGNRRRLDPNKSIVVEATVTADTAKVTAVQQQLADPAEKQKILDGAVATTTTAVVRPDVTFTATAPSVVAVVPITVDPVTNQPIKPVGAIGTLFDLLDKEGLKGDDPDNDPMTIGGATKPKPSHGSGEWTAPLPVETEPPLVPVPPVETRTIKPPVPPTPFHPGAIAGIVLGTLFVLFVVAFLAWKVGQKQGGAPKPKKAKPDLELVGV